MSEHDDVASIAAAQHDMAREHSLDTILHGVASLFRGEAKFVTSRTANGTFESKIVAIPQTASSLPAAAPAPVVNPVHVAAAPVFRRP